MPTHDLAERVDRLEAALGGVRGEIVLLRHRLDTSGLSSTEDGTYLFRALGHIGTALEAYARPDDPR